MKKRERQQRNERIHKAHRRMLPKIHDFSLRGVHMDQQLSLLDLGMTPDDFRAHASIVRQALDDIESPKAKARLSESRDIPGSIRTGTTQYCVANNVLDPRKLDLMSSGKNQIDLDHYIDMAKILKAHGILFPSTK